MDDFDYRQLQIDNIVNPNERETIHVELTRETIKTEEAINFLTNPSSGAINLFLGITRKDEIDADGNASGQVSSLYYESYEEMAVKMMKKLVNHTMERYKLNCCYVVHRLGLVKVCEASLLIGCSSTQRHSAHEATYYLLNQIKKIIPIWKRINDSEEPQLEQSHSTWSSRSEAFWLPRSSQT